MAPLPKRRRSNARKGGRMSHMGIALPTLNSCPQCHTIKRAHQVCPKCGMYAGREVVAMKSAKKPA
ncbi:MAG: 50S ribosomal protein L32 [Chloroflexi bacterium]|nr:50S ribosomal protein L32 [Chloroflexota bacterium]